MEGCRLGRATRRLILADGRIGFGEAGVKVVNGMESTCCSRALL